MESKILIVDDIAVNIQIIANLLQPLGYNLSFARDGKQALKLAQEKEFDLFILDVMMPVIDGYEVCRQLKLNEKTKEIPVIFITAKVDVGSIIKSFEAGAIDYISKPFNPHELLARVNTHLKLRTNAKLLQKKNEYITAGINYAKSIQAAILPGDKQLSKCFDDYFVIFKPKDIVSGDFYWFKEYADSYFLAVADCTGHGVPGALMSMIGNSLLNEILFGKSITSPTQILAKLHKGVVYALSQKDDNKNNINDGMEITIAKINKKDNELTIASSGQTFFITENETTTQHKGDHLFIGSKFITEDKINFQEYKFEIKKGLRMYLTTDGIAEQFDSQRKKQFSNTKILDLLQKESNTNMHELNRIIENTFEQWRGDLHQMDDVLFFGCQF